MIAEYALKADRDVVASWIEGWALSRGVAAPVQVYDGFRVDVGLPDQKARYVFAEASFGVEMVSREIGEPNIFIKVCAPPEAVEPLLASGWSIEPVSFMMTTDDLYRISTCHPDDYQYKLELMPGGYVVTAHAEDGELGASGRVFLVGSTAVFDQIVTHPDHRRRGLGRAIMSELGAVAFRDGATKGSLVATPDGRALYSTLGWRLHALFTTAVRG
jgi:GNAT superfamily N-acetyltransferase